jgi:hypothetical protein
MIQISYDNLFTKTMKMISSSGKCNKVRKKVRI